MPLIVHISDLHFADFNEKVFLKAVDEINELCPDMIILTGDLTNQGYYEEFSKIKEFLSKFDSPLFAVPGNHDARNLGYESFEEIIGESSWKLLLDDDFVIVGLDSSSPDLNEGCIGRPQHLWLNHQLDKAVIDSKFIIVALHHHLIPIPNTGRERNVLTDAGDVLQSIVQHEVDLVICGHKHVSNLWKINETLIVNAGSLCSNKLRGNDINSYNIYNITDNSIEIYLSKIGDERLLLGNFKRN